MANTQLDINKILGGTLLVAGTTIGGGILAFPVASGQTGFLPSVGLFVLFWGFMLFSALVLLEVSLRMKKETDLISMARYSLGPVGSVIGWTSYLFLLYSLLTAYTAAGGGMVQDLLYDGFGIETPAWLDPLPLVAVFGACIAVGTGAVDRMNRILMIGLIITFLATIVMLGSHFEATRLEHFDLSFLTATTSVIATAFGFHIIIPTLSAYLKRDVRSLRITLIAGTTIPLITYIIWEAVTLGSVPLEGDGGLIAAREQGMPITRSVRVLFDSNVLLTLLRLFEFCAIITSFLGVGLSLIHFLKDGLNQKKGTLLIWVLTFGPPLAITLLDPSIFLRALDYAGTLGVLVLLAVLPALMAWAGRRGEKQWVYRAPGGYTGLVLLLAFSLFFIGIEVSRKLNLG